MSNGESNDNASNIAKHIIAGVSRMVEVTFSSEGKDIKKYKSFELKQSSVTHHEFTLVIAHDGLGTEESYEMEESGELKEKALLATFRYKGISDKPERHFTGVIKSVSFKLSQGSRGDIIIKGYSPTIQLDRAINNQSFGGDTSIPLSAVVQELLEQGYHEKGKYRSRIKVSNIGNLSYSSQYRETTHNYLSRMAEGYGQQYYYDGDILHFGDLSVQEKPIALAYGRDIDNLVVHTDSGHVKQELYAYNSLTDEILSATGDTRLELKGSVAKAAYVKVEHASTTPSSQLAPINVSTNQEVTLAQKGLISSEGISITTVSGDTTVPFLYPGCVVELDVLIPGIKVKTHFTTLMITEVHHSVDALGKYTGHFVGVDAEVGYLPKVKYVMPQTTTEIAKVVSNADPLGKGRVQVQFLWQYAGQCTDWIRVMTPYAGGNPEVPANRGITFIPEVGDQVVVDYLGGVPDIPYVLQGSYHGGNAAGGGTNNAVKGIVSRTNVHLLFNDDQHSAKLADPSGNFLFMDGNRNITVTAPYHLTFNAEKITLNARDIELNAYNSIGMTASNSIVINALTSLYTYAATMKQHISGFMQLFSGKALLSSLNSIDIEAKEAKIHGTERMLVHSDKKAIINSKGTSEIHSDQGSNQTNVAADVASTPTEEIAMAVVYFCPQTTWRGEFGFDWLREDTIVKVENDVVYKNEVRGGYKNATTDYTGTEAYEKMKKQYKNIPIKGDPTATEIEYYYVPYLSLFSKEFVDAMPDTIPQKPKYEAELRVFVNIKEDVDRLEFGYRKGFLEIDKDVLTIKTKTQGLVNSTEVIKITCLKDLTQDEEINIYAYPPLKEPKPLKGQDVELNPDLQLSPEAIQLLDRKLVGKIIILQNDENIRQEQNFVFVPVRTNVAGDVRSIIGEFSDIEKTNFYNTFYQALTIPKVVESIEIFLDLSNNSDFQSKTVRGQLKNGKFINKDSKKIFEDWTEWNANGTSKSTFNKEVKKLFFRQKDEQGNLKYSQYTNYFPVFIFSVKANENAAGQIEGKIVKVGGKLRLEFEKNLVLFLGRDSYTLNHEGLHGFNIRHTHRDNTPLGYVNIKYIFDEGKSTNVMAYNSNAYSTWRWQWHIVNPKISEK